MNIECLNYHGTPSMLGKVFDQNELRRIMMINLMKQPIDNKAALKQSIKDDMEVWRIAFNQLMSNNKKKKT